MDNLEVLRTMILLAEPDGFPVFEEEVEEEVEETVGGVLGIFGERFKKRRCRAANGRELLVEAGSGKGKRVSWVREEEVAKEEPELVSEFDRHRRRSVALRNPEKKKRRSDDGYFSDTSEEEGELIDEMMAAVVRDELVSLLPKDSESCVLFREGCTRIRRRMDQYGVDEPPPPMPVEVKLFQVGAVPRSIDAAEVRECAATTSCTSEVVTYTDASARVGPQLSSGDGAMAGGKAKQKKIEFPAMAGSKTKQMKLEFRHRKPIPHRPAGDKLKEHAYHAPASKAPRVLPGPAISSLPADRDISTYVTFPTSTVTLNGECKKVS